MPVEHFRDARGCITVAWVGERVLYARFEKDICADVGERYARRLVELVRSVNSVQYFVDSRLVTEYDILARSAVVRAVLAYRLKFASMIVLSPAGVIGPTARIFASEMGTALEYLTSVPEFEARLRVAAPRASAILAETAEPAEKSRRK
jgi:hypothetical protein